MSTTKYLSLLITGLLTLSSVQCFSQQLQTEVEVFQEAFGLEKKMVVADFMDIQDGEQGFWELYNQYEFERKAIGQQRLKLISAYMANFSNLTDEQIDLLFKNRKKINSSMEKLQSKYFKLMKKNIGTSKAAQFWQLESYIDTIILTEIYSRIPFIGEKLENN